MKVNEIFYSLQGEGCFTGTPAVFVRLSGCNLRCDFCDTDHDEGIEMTAEEIANAVAAYPTHHVVITGGEPALQLSDVLVDALHRMGAFVQIETNGTLRLPENTSQMLDWVTVSPKYGRPPAINRIDELKVVFDMDHTDHIASLSQWLDSEDIDPAQMPEATLLQPCSRPDSEWNAENLRRCIAYILNNPRWRLSLQTHKLLDIR